MPRVTVIAQDKVIGIDGQFIKVDMTYPEKLWAIQWDGKKGTIELRGEAPIAASLGDVSPYIDAFISESARLYEQHKTQAMSVDPEALARQLRDQMLASKFDVVASKPFATKRP